MVPCGFSLTLHIFARIEASGLATDAGILLSSRVADSVA